MTSNNTSLQTIKTLSKRYARANRIPQHRALDLIAVELNFKHWNDLMGASKGKWQPGPIEISIVEALLTKTHPGFDMPHLGGEATEVRTQDIDGIDQGSIGDHRFQIMEALGDVYLAGEGWGIHISEAPHTPPRVEISEQNAAANPIHDEAFLQEALQIAQTRAAQIRAGIASDWPRRCTKPDAQGRVRHPLGLGLSNTWVCLHCNSEIDGQQIADSLWHCPSCKASPMDIFESTFWLDKDAENDGTDEPTPVQISDKEKGAKPIIEIVDTRLKLDLNANNITLLIRAALLEDATNVSERLGALLADISVDEEKDVWIMFDDCLWPEDKDPVQARAVADVLGIEVEESMIFRELPFAWPGIGEHTSSTYDYAKMMLAAYAEQDSASGKK